MKNEINTSSIYLMHKYWGKKPSNELSSIISKYTKENDLVFDPFAGYGGIAIESILQNRNVIINDLNPSAVFISKNLLSENIDMKKLHTMFCEIKSKYENMEKEWYYYKGNKILTILRDKNNTPIKIRVKNHNKQLVEIKLNNSEIKEFVDKEERFNIPWWYPKNNLIINSRISANKSMTVADLFPKRALICQSFLFSLIESFEDCSEKELLLFTFTSNLANCSKLVPPITSRGDMAQGAWMTGFYVGKTYLENNVFHYFENRINKTEKGKKLYLKLRDELCVFAKYTILNEDAKNLSLKSDSIDFVFTDFPYGDTVPYFEQSQLWNSWLKKNVDYDNEIVVSDSKERKKDFDDFDLGINKAISQISRVLKNGKYFVFTFHSLYGQEWNSITRALKQYNFSFVDCETLIQKTLPPRQLNRKNSIKGDIIAIYQKFYDEVEFVDFTTLLEKNILELMKEKEKIETNDLIVLCIKSMLKSSYIDDDIDFNKLINCYFEICEDNHHWRRKKC